jgi:hypothetical protein
MIILTLIRLPIFTNQQGYSLSTIRFIFMYLFVIFIIYTKTISSINLI